MSDTHASIIVPAQVFARTASWYRAAGFPIPSHIPDRALAAPDRGVPLSFTWGEAAPMKRELEAL